MYLRLILLLCFSAANVLCARNESWETTLNKKILAPGIYDVSSPPIVPDGKLISVMLDVNIKSYDLDTQKHILKASLLISMVWTDVRLVWSPEDYGGIRSLRQYSHKVWTPEILLISTSPGSKMYGTCSIEYNGKVLCVAHRYYSSFSANCPFDLSNYPYDDQKCKLLVASWTTDKEMLNVTINRHAGMGFEKSSAVHSKWHMCSNESIVIDFKQHNGNLLFHDKAIEMHFQFHRVATMFGTTILLPYVVAAVLIGACLWLHPLNLTLRLKKMFLSIQIIFVLILALGWELSEATLEVPTIMKLLGRSLFIAIAFMIWFIGSHRLIFSDPMSHFLCGILDSIKSYAVGVSFPKSNSGSLTSDQESGTQAALKMEVDGGWLLLTVLVDRILFVALFLYVVISLI